MKTILRRKIGVETDGAQWYATRFPDVQVRVKTYSQINPATRRVVSRKLIIAAVLVEQPKGAIRKSRGWVCKP